MFETDVCNSIYQNIFLILNMSRVTSTEFCENETNVCVSSDYFCGIMT